MVPLRNRNRRLFAGVGASSEALSLPATAFRGRDFQPTIAFRHIVAIETMPAVHWKTSLRDAIR
jgi:hypothetical protein